MPECLPPSTSHYYNYMYGIMQIACRVSESWLFPKVFTVVEIIGVIVLAWKKLLEWSITRYCERCE
jgi:hypothetical protein